MKDTSNKKPLKLFPKSPIYFALGLMAVLFGVIAIINLTIPSQFLAYISAYLFGTLYFVPWALLIVYGLWLMFFPKKKKAHVVSLLIGGTFIFLSLATLLSSTDTSFSLNINNFYPTFAASIGDISSIYNAPLDIYHNSLGGGLLGHTLSGLLLSGITYYGLIAFFVIFFLVGFIFVFFRPLKKMFRSIRAHAKARHERRVAQYEEAKKVTPLKKEDEKAETPLFSAVSPKKEEKIFFENIKNETFSKDETSVDINLNSDDNLASKEEEIPLSNPTQVAIDQSKYSFFARKITDNHGMSKAHFILPDSQTNKTVIREEIKPSKPVEEPIIKEEPSIDLSKQNVRESNEIIEGSILPPENSIPNEPIKEENAKVEQLNIDLNKPQYDQDLVATKPREANTNVVSSPKPVQKRAMPRQEYAFPDISLLNDYEVEDDIKKNDEVAAERTAMMNTVFEDLNVGATITGYTIGPSITRFDISTNRDVMISSVNKVIDDISIRLGGVMARFEPIVRGKSTSGLEIPNAIKTLVGFKETFCKLPEVKGYKHRLDIPFGKDISGEVIFAPLDDFPHLLVAGTTGSGKSVYMHSVIMSLIMRNRPEDLKFLIVDPKRVEMTKYRDMPHLLCPIITEPSKANVAFNRLVDEMERRYDLFADSGNSNLKQYNEYAEEEGLETLPFIIIVVDEYADLVQTCKDIAVPVMRLGQKSRAAGIHMIISTQRPSTNIITGDIKANLPVRVALSTASSVDSVTMVGEGGAELLLGNGDMLVDCPIISRQGLTRLQGCFVDNKEIKRVVDFIKSESEPHYDENFLNLIEKSADNSDYSQAYAKPRDKDEMYDVVKQSIQTREYASISMIQREFGFGFPRAGKIFQQLKDNGVVAKEPDSASSAKGCRVLIKSDTTSENIAVDSNGESPQADPFIGD